MTAIKRIANEFGDSSQEISISTVASLKANEAWPTLTTSVGIAVLGIQREKPLYLQAT